MALSGQGTWHERKVLVACEISCTVKSRPRIFHAFKRFGDSSRSRKMPKTVPFYGQEGYIVKNFLPVKVIYREAIAVRVCSYTDLAKKCQKKFQKILTKNRPFGILPSRATRMPFTSYRASFEEEPVHQSLSWFEPYGHRVILHGRKCRRIVCTLYFTGVLYHDISSRYAGAGASVVSHAGEAGARTGTREFGVCPG